MNGSQITVPNKTKVLLLFDCDKNKAFLSDGGGRGMLGKLNVFILIAVTTCGEMFLENSIFVHTTDAGLIRLQDLVRSPAPSKMETVYMRQ